LAPAPIHPITATLFQRNRSQAGIDPERWNVC
jgi:hypothetical protein